MILPDIAGFGVDLNNDSLVLLIPSTRRWRDFVDGFFNAHRGFFSHKVFECSVSLGDP